MGKDHIALRAAVEVDYESAEQEGPPSDKERDDERGEFQWLMGSVPSMLIPVSLQVDSRKSRFQHIL